MAEIVIAIRHPPSDLAQGGALNVRRSNDRDFRSGECRIGFDADVLYLGEQR